MDASSGLQERVSTSVAQWFTTPLGRYLLSREQAYFDRTVADIFGFLALLGFDVVGGWLDAYVPPFATDKWLHRFAFFENAGDRWWPIAGGVYFLRAMKRVAGMRVITPAWNHRAQREKALAPATRAREGLTTHRHRSH